LGLNPVARQTRTGRVGTRGGTKRKRFSRTKLLSRNSVQNSRRRKKGQKPDKRTLTNAKGMEFLDDFRKEVGKTKT